MAEVISVQPEKIGEDKVITKKNLEENLIGKKIDALVIRTLPNLEEKTTGPQLSSVRNITLRSKISKKLNFFITLVFSIYNLLIIKNEWNDIYQL